MLGTFGGALEARKIDASDGRLSADVRGEIETEDGVLVIRRIHGVYIDRCPVYRSLRSAIQITSSYKIVS